jgi:hypothetical protein
MYFWCRQHKLDQRMVRHQLGAVPLFCACHPRHEWASRLPQGPRGDSKAFFPPADIPVLKLIKFIAGEKKIEIFALFWGFL